jgi:chromosome partitioning protein
MNVLAVATQKGGSGKTTTAVNLAAAAGEAGQRVLVLDLDPQASATKWLGVVPARDLLAVFTEGAPLAPLVQPTATPGVEVIPASPWLVGIDKVLAGEVGTEALLRPAVAALPRCWDVVFIDCPPSTGLLSVAALVACQGVLVPVEASSMGLDGLASLIGTVERVRTRLNPELYIAALLACRVTRTNLARDVVASLRERFGDLVLPTVIRESVRLQEAPSFAQPITAYDPEGRGAEDYRAAAGDLLARLAQPVGART